MVNLGTGVTSINVNQIALNVYVLMEGLALFHHQIATCTENVKFREVNVDLLPGTSSGK